MNDYKFEPIITSDLTDYDVIQRRFELAKCALQGILASGNNKSNAQAVHDAVVCADLMLGYLGYTEQITE